MLQLVRKGDDDETLADPTGSELDSELVQLGNVCASRVNLSAPTPALMAAIGLWDHDIKRVVSVSGARIDASFDLMHVGAWRSLLDRVDDVRGAARRR